MKNKRFTTAPQNGLACNRRIRRVISGVLASTLIIVLFVVASGLSVWAEDQEHAANPNTQPSLSAPPDVAAPPADAQVTPSGMATKILKQGNGSEHPAANDCVRVTFTAWKRDGTLFATSTSMDSSEILCLNVALQGVFEALQTMVVGERRRLWLPVELTYKVGHHHGQKRPEDEDPPKANLTFDIELGAILKAPPTPDDLTSPPADAVKTPSGLIYKMLKNGTGNTHPSMSNNVLVHFSCWTKQGRIFESTIMAGHPALIRLATAMAGWREALPHMVAGDKARLWIPAALAYGEAPANRFHPPGDLVYDIELLAVQ
jgi:FKBP-type peptidyl-prolyl cis-trans isomerase